MTVMNALLKSHLIFFYSNVQPTIQLILCEDTPKFWNQKNVSNSDTVCSLIDALT